MAILGFEKGVSDEVRRGLAGQYNADKLVPLPPAVGVAIAVLRGNGRYDQSQRDLAQAILAAADRHDPILERFLKQDGECGCEVRGLQILRGDVPSLAEVSDAFQTIRNMTCRQNNLCAARAALWAFDQAQVRLAE